MAEPKEIERMTIEELEAAIARLQSPGYLNLTGWHDEYRRKLQTEIRTRK